MNCVKGEIHNVLSMMRVNALWASVDRFRAEIPAATQSPMLRAFKQLHYELQSVTDLADVDTVTYLLPFVMVIESERTSGFITGAAIASLNKFLLYGLITGESLRADVAINRIAVCVARCRFEETHRADDEAVLMKLLELVEYALRSDAGHLIADDNVWKMVQLCYSISCQPRSSLHLRRAAENTLSHLVLTVFDRIEDLEPSAAVVAEVGGSPPKHGGASTHHHHSPAGGNSSDGGDGGDQRTTTRGDSTMLSSSSSSSSQQTTLPAVTPVPTKSGNVPYGIPVLERVLHFLAGLVSPMENDEATCVLGLRLINIVLETAGTGLSHHPCLVSVLQGDLSKFLLQNSETDDLGVLSLTLRVVFNLFNSIKDHLKVQLEVFFTSVHMRIIDSPSCSDEQKELALESLLEFCREPALMLDLYINYDCDVHCTNLFEVLCKSLARNCDAMATTDVGLNALTLLCLEGLLAVVESIARRCPLSSGATSSKSAASNVLSLKGSDLARYTSNTRGSAASPRGGKFSRGTSMELPLDDISPLSSVRDLMQLVMSGSESDSESDQGGGTGESGDPADQLAWLHTARERTAEVLQQRKRAKKRYALAAEKFNTDQKNWIAFSQEIGLLPESPTPETVAAFLLHTPGLNKTLIGDYLGDGPPEKYPFNTAVRDAYVSMFDFHEAASLDEALRDFLAKFRLPGEAQKIDRMMEAFSKQYYLQAGSAGPLADADAAYVLAFSIIMLNTDLHSDHIAKKMTIEEFVRNNRGINAGQDLPEDYLTDLYYNILEHEIQMQHDVSDFMDSAFSTVDRYSMQWEGVLKRSENVVGASFTSNASILKLRAGLYEKDMFTLIADRTIQSLLVAFEKTLDVTNMERALEGLSNCAKIALYFGMSDMFNRIMGSLSSYFLAFAHGILSGEKVFLPPSSGTNVKARAVGASSGSATRQATAPDSTGSESSGGSKDSEVFSGAVAGAIEEDRVHGAKTRRALLSLKLLFQFVQNRNESFRKAWTNVVECVLMFNELDAVPISLVEIDDFVDSRGVPLPPVLGGSSVAQTLHSVSSSTSTTVSLSPTNSGSSNSNASGLSGKTRERSRRLAERQAAIRSRMKSMNYASHAAGSGGGGAYQSPGSSGSLWDSLSSYLWAEEERIDESFSLVNKMLREAVSKLGGGLLEKENWLRMARKLPEKALISLLETLLACRDPFKCILQPSDQTSVDAMMQENAILVLELSVDIILVNQHRILALNLWEPFHMYAKRILSTPLHELHMQGLVERVVVHILRVSIRLFHDEKIRPKLMATLELLLTMDEDMCKALSDRLASGINMLLKANLVYMHDFHDWQVLLGVLESVVQHKNGRAACWESVTLMAEGGHLNDENVTLWMAICLQFVRHRTPYSVDALRLLQGLASSDSAYKMDGKTWLEVMRVMLSYLSDDRAPIAKTAWECLYKSLLLPGVPIAKDMWKQCFEHVIFPFDDQVGEGVWDHSKDAPLYNVTLLSKTFLHNLTVLMELPEFGELWLNVLERLAKKLVITTAGPPAPNAVVVYETTLQSLYNLLLVLKAEDVLERISDDTTGQTLFEESCAVIDAVCPHVKEQLGFVPEEPQSADTPDEEKSAEAEAVEQEGSVAADTVTEQEQRGEPVAVVEAGAEVAVEVVASEDASVSIQVEVQPIEEHDSAPVDRTGDVAVSAAEDTGAPAERRPSPGTWRTAMETVVIGDGTVGVKADEVILDEITEAV